MPETDRFGVNANTKPEASLSMLCAVLVTSINNIFVRCMEPGAHTNGVHLLFRLCMEPGQLKHMNSLYARVRAEL